MPTRSAYIQYKGIDPLVAADESLANELYGRVTSVADATGPENNVWLLLMRRMYGVIAGEVNKAAGTTEIKRRAKTPDDVRGLPNADLRTWARAFNTAVKAMVEQDKIPKLRVVGGNDKTTDISTWHAPLKTTAAGDESADRYKGEDQRKITDKKLDKMDEYRAKVIEAVNKDPNLKDPNKY